MKIEIYESFNPNTPENRKETVYLTILEDNICKIFTDTNLFETTEEAKHTFWNYMIPVLSGDDMSLDIGLDIELTSRPNPHQLYLELRERSETDMDIILIGKSTTDSGLTIYPTFMKDIGGNIFF